MEQPTTPPTTRREIVAAWVKTAVEDGTARAVMLAYITAYQHVGFDQTLPAMMAVVRERRPGWPDDDVADLAMEIANWTEAHHGRWLRRARMAPDRPYWELQEEAQATLLDHAVRTMIANGTARRAVQAYLLALANAQDAERAAVRIIRESQPSLTLSEPGQALQAIVKWTETHHGEWWRAALGRTAGNTGMGVRELYRTGHVLIAECDRHHKGAGRIFYDVRRIEYLLSARNPSVRDAMRQLYCPNCRIPVAVRVVPASEAQGI